jgi:multidrug efflux pump subunit AcrB
MAGEKPRRPPWRSTLIVVISIPLSILTSIVILYFMGHTLNTMTLGGMALAVGILVDDSTVTIENRHRLRSAGEEQNAAPARAVIGGLLFAIPTTLLIVPYLFAIAYAGRHPWGYVGRAP